MKLSTERIKSKYTSFFQIPILFFVAFLLSATMFSATTLNTHAEVEAVPADGGGVGGNGEGGDSGPTTKHITNGPSYTKQFWLLYITDASGTIQSDVVMYQSQEINCDFDYFITRPEHGSVKATRFITETPIFGWSFTYDNASQKAIGRGSEVKKILTSSDPATPGQPVAATVVEQLWGKETAQQWVSNQWYLILEDGIWSELLGNDGSSLGVFAGTSYGWGYIQDYLGINPNGCYLINRYTNGILPNSSRLEFNQTGVVAPITQAEKVSNDEMEMQGFGMLIVWAGESEGSSSTHTWDSPHHPSGSGSEAEAPTPPSTSTPSERHFTILKSFPIF